MEPVDVREHAVEAAIMAAAPEPAVLAVVTVAVQNAAVLAWNRRFSTQLSKISFRALNIFMLKYTKSYTRSLRNVAFHWVVFDSGTNPCKSKRTSFIM